MMASALLETYPGDEHSRRVWIREEGETYPRQMKREDDPMLIGRAEIRASIEAAALLTVSLSELSERLIALLDDIDGDPDREGETDKEPSPGTFSAPPTYGADQRIALTKSGKFRHEYNVDC